MTFEIVDRKWNWLDDGVLPYALAALRAIWVSVLVRMISIILPTTRTDLISPMMVLALLVVSTLAAQFATFRIRSNVIALLILAGGGLIAVGAALYLTPQLHGPFWDLTWARVLIDAPFTSFFVLAVAAWLWRWGIITVQQPTGYDTYAFNFMLGLGVFAVAIYVSSNARLVAPSSLILPLLSFFALGLGTLTIASLASSRRFERAYSKQSFSLNRYWLGTVALIIGLILLTGFILGQLFAPEVAANLIALFAKTLDLLTAALAAVLLVLSFLVFAPLEWLVGFFHIRITFLGQGMPEAAEPWGEYFQKRQEEPLLGFSPEFYAVLKVIAICLLIAILLLIFAQAFKRLRSVAQGEIDEEHETLLSTDLLKKQLAGLFPRRSHGSARPSNPFVDLSGQTPGIQVRRIYQALLAWATARGFPRPAGVTPGEYQALLMRGLEIDRRGLALITSAYVQARYSPESISAAQAEEVARAWERIAHTE